MKTPQKLSIGNRQVGSGFPCFIIAEVGLAHYGVLGLAHAYIDAAAEAGVDAVKFQTHLAEFESSPAETFRVPISSQYATRAEYWEKTSFAAAQWAELKEHADRSGLVFLSSPFCNQAVDMLERVGVAAWKVASGEITNAPLLDHLGRTGKPVILSTGMSGWAEVAGAVRRMQRHGTSVAVMQCTSEYPASAEHLGLNMVAELSTRLGCPSGLSDHSGLPWPGIAAAALGASIIEVHLTLADNLFGPDVRSSLTPGRLKDLVAGIRYTETSLAHPVDKDDEERRLCSMRTLFMKSVAAGRDLPAGTRLRENDLEARKPGNGVPIQEMHTILGRVLATGRSKGEIISFEDLQ